MLRFLRHEWHGARRRMCTTIVLFANLFVPHDAMLLRGIEYTLRYMTMLGNTFDLRMGSEFLLERFLVLQFGTFTGSNCAQFLGCIWFPQPNVHFVRTAVNVFVVQWPAWEEQKRMEPCSFFLTKTRNKKMESYRCTWRVACVLCGKFRVNAPVQRWKCEWCGRSWPKRFPCQLVNSRHRWPHWHGLCGFSLGFVGAACRMCTDCNPHWRP